MNRPTLRHQEILLALASQLLLHTRAKQLGKVAIEVNLELPNGQHLHTRYPLLLSPNRARVWICNAAMCGVCPI